MFRNLSVLPENFGPIKIGKTILPRALELINRAIAREVKRKHCPSILGVEKHPSHFEIYPKKQHDNCMIIVFKNAEIFLIFSML